MLISGMLATDRVRPLTLLRAFTSELTLRGNKFAVR
jgi:hypothetical protein